MGSKELKHNQVIVENPRPLKLPGTKKHQSGKNLSFKNYSPAANCRGHEVFYKISKSSLLLIHVY